MSKSVSLLLVGLSVVGCTAANNGGAGSGAAGGSAGQSAAGSPSAGSSSAGASSGGSANSAGAANTGGAANTAGAANAAGAAGGTGIGGAAGSAGASGATGSAGAAGAAGAGGGTAFPSGCGAVTNAKFCEDWDKLPMGKPVGDYSVSGSGVVVDNTKAFSGTQALHFLKMPAPAKSNPFINFTKQFPLASNDLHGRIMYYMAQTPKTGSHWDFITSHNSGQTQWSIGGQGGVFELVCDPPDNGLDSKTAWPSGKWVCMQWEFKYPGNPMTTFVAKVDGVSVDKGEFTGKNSAGDTWVAGTWSDLKFDWEVFGSSDIDVEFWIDDLAFGEQTIPCPTMM